ncbi:MAG: phosphoglycerate mutase family protein [Anaerolineales bacterium]
MAFLILVKHALPDIDPQESPHLWQLSSAGRDRCTPLAQALSAYQPDRIIASPEPKAEQTGRLVAKTLRIPFETRANLHEHSRRTESFATSKAFKKAISELFRQPQALMYGEETGEQAYERFASAIHSLLEEYPGENLVVVAHGTVISLFVSRTCTLDGYALWERLELPSYLVLSRDEAQNLFRLETIVGHV